MSPWTAFKNGMARIWFHKRLLLWLYLINLVFASVLVFPFRNVVSEISKTDLADEFVSGFTVDSFAVFWSEHSSAFKSLGSAAVGLGVLYLIVNIFLVGGIITTLTAEHRVSLRRFFYNASRYFGRYLRLFVLLGIVIGLIFTAYGTWVNEYVEDLQKDAMTDMASFLWRGLAVVVLLVFISLVLMVFDYAKIRTVVDGRRSMFLAAVTAFGFSLRRPLRTVSLFYLNLVIVVLLFAIYLFVENQFSNATVISMVGLFVIQQLFILSRIWMRLSFFSTQLVFYRSASEVPPTAPPEETEAVSELSSEA
ncbi:MAG: hypothetical protein WBE26_10575 [Phycisphaerae bacterium]